MVFHGQVALHPGDVGGVRPAAQCTPHSLGTAVGEGEERSAPHIKRTFKLYTHPSGAPLAEVTVYNFHSHPRDLGRLDIAVEEIT